MGSHSGEAASVTSVIMGNAQARQRIKARDFDYLAKFTGFATEGLVENYFDNLMDKYPDGEMETADFIETFKIAFPERPDDKIQKLAVNMSNKDGKISMANMLILFYLFSGGKLEDNLVGIFNLFDADGNKVITLNELYEMMAVMIEIEKAKIIRWILPRLWLKCSTRLMPTKMR